MGISPSTGEVRVLTESAPLRSDEVGITAEQYEQVKDMNRQQRRAFARAEAKRQGRSIK